MKSIDINTTLIDGYLTHIAAIYSVPLANQVVLQGRVAQGGLQILCV